MDSGSYVVDSSSLLAPPPRFPLSMTTSRHSLPNLDPNDMVVSLFLQDYSTYLFSKIKVLHNSKNNMWQSNP